MRPEAASAIAAVRESLALAMTEAGVSTMSVKEGRDVVTATDVAVEDLIRERLRVAFSYPVIGEERGGEPPPDGSPYWLVDPICGTRNFASGSPLYCVNLALVEDGFVTVAAAGDPSRDEVVFAERGEGAWALRYDRSTRLIADANSRTLVVEEGKAKGATREHAARFFAEVVRSDRWDFRSFGSTLALPYLAAGRISAYVVFYVTRVHAAAGSLLVSEAGGTLSDIAGQPWTLEAQSLLFAATPALHLQLLELARRTRS
jgi:myo-inositol-1(or 4)-monophosphatase